MNYNEVRRIVSADLPKEEILARIDTLEREDVQKVIQAMSYTEMMIIKTIIRHFKENHVQEETFTVSDLTDKEGVSRSIGVNAIRKLESAGLLESRSLGMKGTRIKILNDKLLEWGA